MQTGDVDDQVLQGTCNLFGPLTVATIAQSKNRHRLGATHEARKGNKNWEAEALTTGLLEGIGLATITLVIAPLRQNSVEMCA
jgi:hypothetical protein